MITNFDNFINEIKNYPLYKSVSTEVFEEILKDFKIKNIGTFDSPLRGLVIPSGKAISATRSFNYAKKIGSVIFEFDMFKLSSKFKIKPFCENPDYYLDNFDAKEKNIDIYKNIRDKFLNKEFWEVKTDKGHFDYGICEELIDAKEIDIRVYVKKIFIENTSAFNKDLEMLKDKYSIEYEILN